jgi:YesN/AraC family two-component response regulator
MAARVLIVDDESYIRDLIRDTLRTRQYQTGTAANGVEALDILSRGNYDILVTDVVMPGMNGLELVKQVRHQHPRIRIIVLTGFPRSADIGDFLAEGVDDFLSKPFRANDLVTVIRRLEEKMGAAAGGGKPAPAPGPASPGQVSPGPAGGPPPAGPGGER